ncbi:probable nicotinate-nucleotide adenylyltransferase [Kipferlia bialata]|uniref:Probable nicotinate-nucleotide adenylyltransferase n=1 Tax=Kipferlia bialata TaxID=797122 RepID=A0A391NJ05_9EUKA|nr:probable nicotinate-nucleotide adenylyltransferase [Kipferlia bialata]GCA62605.1 probable nicotinate-nucleotide adenylyltransferase [Kipferlia bialata]|eukprot:g1694.t1
MGKDDTRPVIMVQMGSFNPVTLSHLLVIEQAKGHFEHKMGRTVAGCLMSPVSDGYRWRKPNLLDGVHRLAMLEGALAPYPHIAVDSWECSRAEWTRTKVILDHVAEDHPGHAVCLVAGIDMLESMVDTSIWNPKDVAAILDTYYIYALPRPGGIGGRDTEEVRDIIAHTPHMAAHLPHIQIDTEAIQSVVSSSLVRERVGQGMSVRFMVPDPVLEYIEAQGLYLPKVEAEAEAEAVVDL